MDKFPLLWDQNSVGELETQQHPQQTVFSVRCRLPGPGLWCAWAVGDRGELRLGVLQPEGQYALLKKQFSYRMTEQLGKIQGGEIRPAGQQRAETIWKPLPEEKSFQTPWLRQQLGRCSDVLWAKRGERQMVAVPYEENMPYPMMPMFCFASLQTIRGRRYLVTILDSWEYPDF